MIRAERLTRRDFVSLRVISFVLAVMALPLVVLAGEPGVPQVEIRWGQRGAGDGEFNFPSGVAVGPGGDVYVADSRNHRIQKFDRDGNFLLKWGTFCNISDGSGCEGEGNGQFNEPRGIAVSGNGDLFVADTLNARLQKFDSSGGFLMKWGSFGTGSGKFTFPIDVAVSSDGMIFVVDNNQGRLTKFDANGDFLTSWATAATPRGVAADKDDDVFVIAATASKAQKFDADGTLLTEWGEAGSGPGQFSIPEGIEVDANGDVYVADTSNGRIQQFDNDGNFLLEFGRGSLSSPVDVAVGSIFIVERFGRIQRWGLSGETPVATRTPTPSGPTPTPTSGTPLPACVGDCDANGKVSVADLVVGVNIALGNRSLDSCPVFDVNDDDAVDVSELIAGVSSALGGCAG